MQIKIEETPGNPGEPNGLRVTFGALMIWETTAVDASMFAQVLLDRARYVVSLPQGDERRDPSIVITRESAFIA